jgi:hypothetical protein
MRHGDELEIVPQGIRLPQKTVEPLGIVDGSRCWGRWVRGQRKDSTGEVSHLAISPVHPIFWASVFHLEMRLDEHPGSLERATELLSELGVNLLFSDGALSGYRQATFTAVCELQRARQRAREILKIKEFPPSPLFDEADSVAFERVRERRFQEIGASLLLHLADLHARIRVHENGMFERWKRDRATDQRPFLHSRAVETGSQPWYLPHSVVEAIAEYISVGVDVPVGDPRSAEEVQELAKTFRALQSVLATREHSRLEGAPLRTQEALEASAYEGDLAAFTRHYLHTLWHNHWVEPVSLRGLLTLAYQRVWSDDRPEIVFQYDARQNLLRFKDADDKVAFFDKCRFKVTRHEPGLGIASIHKHDRFIRLRVLRPSESRRLVTARVNYRVLGGEENLLHSESTTSQSIVHDSRTEKGRIKLVGFLPSTSDQSDARALDVNLEARMKEFRRSHPDPVCTVESWVDPYLRGKRKLFLSIPQNARRIDEIVAEVEAVALRHRFVVVQSRTQAGEVTSEVVQRVQGCDAMVQVYVPRQQPNRPANSFDWLVAEYALARGRQMPILRLREKTVADTAQSIPQLFDRDRPVETFSLDDPLEKGLGVSLDLFLEGLIRSYGESPGDGRTARRKRRVQRLRGRRQR